MDGLRVQPSVPGIVTCLKCGKPFKSPDRTRIRRCTKCEKDKERIGLVGETACRVTGCDSFLTGGDYDSEPTSATVANNDTPKPSNNHKPIDKPKPIPIPPHKLKPIPPPPETFKVEDYFA